MNVKFSVKAECCANDIEIKLTADELARKLEELIDYSGIKSVVEVSGLTYEEDGETVVRQTIQQKMAV